MIADIPYPESGRIVTVSQTVRSTGALTHDASAANFLDWTSDNTVFSHMAAGRSWLANLAGGDQPERVRTTMVSSQFFSLFRVNPLFGRSLGPQDAKPGSDHVAVLSYALWTRRYGAQRNVLGQDLILDGGKVSIVGVMPPNFSPDDYAELWVPSPWDVPTHPLSPSEDPRQFRDRNYLEVWARLKSDVTLEQARAKMNAVGQRLEKQYPNANQDTGVALVPMHEEAVSGVRPTLLLLTDAVGFLLLIACANVVNLLLARGATRSREIAIRTALGASRGRLVRQLLTESVLLALLGGFLGAVLAIWALPILLALSPPEIGRFTRIGLNGDVLAFGLAVSIFTGVLFGVAPAIFTARSDPNESLRKAERGNSLGRGSARSALVVAEIALSFVLLIGAALMVKSFGRLIHVDPGFNPDRVLVLNVGLPSSAGAVQQTAFYEEVIAHLSVLPDVQSAGAVSRLPLAGGNSSRTFNTQGDNKIYSADIRVSTSEYFRTMGIPLLKGRNFADYDTSRSSSIAIINQAAAANIFPGQDPIGKYLTNFGPQSVTLQIVGVVGNVRHIGLETAARPEIYLPITQMQWPSMFITVRTATTNPLHLVPAVQRTVWSIDRNVALANMRTMEDVLAQSVLRRKFVVSLLSIFAGVAVLLAAIGLYGVISYSISQRTKEIGIRMALGARKVDMMIMVLRQSFTIAAIGLVIGLIGAFGATRLISALLFGVSPSDFSTYLIVTTLLGIATLIASYWPARRAMAVDPTVALRYE
jgi:putative ABC transport system permease protein